MSGMITPGVTPFDRSEFITDERFNLMVAELAAKIAAGGGGASELIGDLSNLTTEAKANLVAAINELDSEIGDLSGLTTTAKNTIIAAVNEVDSAIGQKAEKTQLSNPNLLMNAYFPIWQRGTSFGSGVYSADRWIGFSANGNVQVTKDTDSSLKISATQAEFAGITQPIEGKYRDLVGKKVTLSAKVKSTIPILLSVETGGTTVDSAVFPTSAEYTIISKTLTLPASINENTLRVLVVGNQQIGTINVAWVKFELGDIATPFSPRPYAEELVMCQRYYQRIDIFGEVCWSAFYLYTGYFYFSPIMRVSPTLTFSALKDGALGKISVYNVDSNFNKNATVSAQLLTSSKFRLYGNAEFIPDTTYVGGAVIADAEIY